MLPRIWFNKINPKLMILRQILHAVKLNLIVLFSKSTFLSGMTIIISKNNSPGYQIISLGTTKKKIVEMTGLQLITNRLV